MHPQLPLLFASRPMSSLVTLSVVIAPMQTANLLQLSLATIILGLSPGPAVFATLARALQLGLRPTFIFIAGIVAGDFVFVLVTLLGLAALAAAFTPLFVMLRVAGGLYLIYLGLRAWRSASRMDLATAHPQPPAALFLSGFMLTASNPKDLLFFLTFLPAFVDPLTASARDMTLAALTITLSFIFTLSLYALGAEAIRRRIANTPALLKHLNRAAAVLLIGVGALLLVQAGGLFFKTGLNSGFLA